MFAGAASFIWGLHITHLQGFYLRTVEETFPFRTETWNSYLGSENSTVYVNRVYRTSSPHPHALQPKP